MSSATDPIRRLRQRITTTWIVGVVPIVLCALWMLSGNRDQPAATVPADPPQVNPTVQEPDQPPSLDTKAFAITLWNAPPPPVRQIEAPPETPRSPRQPLNLQLIGITNDNGRLLAAVFDPQSGTLHIVAGGEQIQQHTVTAITAEYVEFDDGRGARRLELDRHGPEQT